jgi:hypothetical protein
MSKNKCPLSKSQENYYIHFPLLPLPIQKYTKRLIESGALLQENYVLFQMKALILGWRKEVKKICGRGRSHPKSTSFENLLF